MDWSDEQIDEAEKRIIAQMGPEDKEWNRGLDDGKYYHNAPGNHAASVEYEIGYMLRDLVIQQKPEVLVEVGTNRGFSTTWLLLGMLRNRKGTLYTYDTEDVQKTYGKLYWQDFGLPEDRIKIRTQATWDAAADGTLPQPIDFVFHDASHDVVPTQQELNDLAPRVSRGRMMTFHDINLCRHMGEVVLAYFNTRPVYWTYQEVSKGRGLGIAVRK